MEQKILKLTLKKKWFDMILSGKKTEEYREIKPYWKSRLLPYEHFTCFICQNNKNSKDIDSNLQSINCKIHGIYSNSFAVQLHSECNNFVLNENKIEYDKIHFFNGGYYSDKLSNFQIELKGVEISTGKPEWGAKPDKKYFVLKLGRILSKSNCG